MDIWNFLRFTYPLLSVGVFQVRDGLRVPGPSDSQQTRWPEPIFGHDDEVGEEPGRCLHHSDLSVCYTDQSKRISEDPRNDCHCMMCPRETSNKRNIVLISPLATSWRGLSEARKENVRCGDEYIHAYIIDW